jgi:transcriptional regulator with XRE-family HTH domain
LKTAKKSGRTAKHGRGTGVPDPVDLYVGARIRARRLLIGMNQETLARKLELTFQQVQKYEGGANRVSASRLAEIAQALGVDIDYFFAGLQAAEAELNAEESKRRELMEDPESLALVRLYYGIADQGARAQFLEMVKTLGRASGSAE